MPRPRKETPEAGDSLKYGTFLGYTGSDYKGTAVLYARFSSHNQREVSIEDQLKTDNDYCIRNKLKVVGVYYDAAISGRTDNRPDFQRMIKNAPESDYVVVYMMERFSRGEYDAPLYKYELQRKGVKVLSALEYIPETPEGILIEKLLEGQAAYFSLDLSRKITRGMNSNAEKCMDNGNKVFGYTTDPETQKYVIDEEEAAVVREVFSRYIAGETMNALGEDLARRGFKTCYGNPVTGNFISHLVHNERYLGIYIWGEVRKVGGMPQIINKATFDAAQNVTRRKVRANEDWTEYPLTGKLFCAICGQPMHGMSATGRHGGKYHYYACKKNGGCERKPVRKDKLEAALCAEATAIIDNPATARHIAELVVNQYKEGDVRAALKSCRQKLKDNENAMRQIDRAIEQGLFTPNTRNRIDELNHEHEQLEAELGRLMAEDLGLTVEDLTEFLLHGFAADDSDLILGGFVNQVFLFDGYAVGTLNFRNEQNELAEVRVAMEELGFEQKGNPPADAEGFACNLRGGA